MVNLKELSKSATTVLCLLILSADAKARTRCTQKQIYSNCNVSQASVTPAIAELVKGEFIGVVDPGEKGGPATYEVLAVEVVKLEDVLKREGWARVEVNHPDSIVQSLGFVTTQPIYPHGKK